MATSNKMVGRCVFLVGFFLFARDSQSQINVLTYPEAEAILENAPLVKAARDRGACPAFQLDNENEKQFTIAAVALCHPRGFEGSATVGHYFVDRIRGTVDMNEEGPEPMVSLAKTLSARAKARILTATESACLARQAVSDLSAPGAGVEISVDPNGTQNVAPFETEFFVSVLDKTGNGAFIDVAVNASTLTVRDRARSTVMDSERLDRLVSDLRSIRLPIELSAVEALRIALKCPLITSNLSDRCSTLRTDSFEGTADAVLIGESDHCPGPANGYRTVAAVNVRTGSVTDPSTGRSLDSPESEILAASLLKGKAESVVRAHANIQAACGN